MEKSSKSHAVNYGIYLSLILVLFTVLAYAFKIELLVNFWLTLLLLPVIIIAFGVVSSAKAKSLSGGFINFKNAFTAYLIPVAIGLILNTIVAIVIFNFVDPDSADYLKELVISKSQAFMESVGAPQSEIDKSIATMQEQDTFAIGTQLRSLAQSFIFFIVIGLIVGLIMKKKDPNAA
ncbi:DUF4199 domain-containing protein [uncultured Psychroserpens sp.]|uniref:DUF4199 domain-containing protein n=1 Tax=uncultured Psychroserpens sp. TaxID=255436 RepID=UPI00262AF03E|nr:DUF4199 domain-containing protein [uncultured Psychroserpens sp.]